MEKQRQQYQAGIYCRLSKDDAGSGDSSSIESQKDILEKYVQDNGWQVYDYYVDDGYTGTNYDRPGFQRMIEDVEAGKINLIAVKDLSRLGRNYIMTGQYTDIYFPDRGVRFVALNDGIDSVNADNDIAPFRNILNQMYSTDISKKVRSAVRAKKQKGLFLSNYAPYGYRKDPLDKNHLVIEERGAEVVRRIYDMCLSGMGSRKISNLLTKEGIPSPSNHRASISNAAPRQEKNRWHTESVMHILKSRIYVGDMVQGIYECARFKRTPSKLKAQDEWIITPNTHEGIVDVETWEHAQEMIGSRKRVIKNGEVQLFAGLLKCADCGRAMSYAYCQGIEQYTCGQYRRYGREYCSCHYIRRDMLKDVVLDDIRKYARLAKENEAELAEKLASLHGDREGSRTQSLTDELKTAESRIQELDRIMKRLFEQLALDGMSDKLFHKLAAGYEAEQETLEARISSIKDELESRKQSKEDMASWLALIRDFAEIQELDRVVLTELIDKITVGESKVIDGEKHIDITIYYRFIGDICKQI